MASKDLPTHLVQEIPIYGHWLSIKIYREYLSLQEQVQRQQDTLIAFGYKYKCEDVIKCAYRISRAVNCYKKREASASLSGRGIWASELLRASELTYTAQLVNRLEKLVFPDPSSGCIFHQMPTRKRPDTSGNPELADGYCCCLVYDNLDEPFVTWDTKLTDLEHARRTSICHSINIVQVNHNYNKWPVVISLPNTTKEMSLEVHIPVQNTMLVCPVLCKDPSVDLAFLCLVAASIKYVCEEKPYTESPLQHMLPMKSVRALIPGCANMKDCRTFFDHTDNCVYKFFSKEDMDVARPNVDVMMKYGNIPNVSLINITADGTILAVKYDYISGSHKIENVKQLVGVLETLMKLHQADLVHGDVRACNIVFTPSSSHLIDFDLTRPVDTRYHRDFNCIEEERHDTARSGSFMKKYHDRYALSLLLKRQLPSATDVCRQLENESVDLKSVLKSVKTFGH